MSNVFKGLFGGGGGSKKVETSGSAPAAKKLFSPEQVQQVTKNYGRDAGAKWNQIMAGMQAGGGTGGPDLSATIQNQASTLGGKLGELTTASGYGEDGMGQAQNILRDLEKGAGFQYNLYG